MIDLDGVGLGSPPGGSEFRHRMGLRRLGPGMWLELSHPDVDHQRAEKARLMAQLGDELFIVLPSAQDAALELQEEIAAEFERQHVSAPKFDPSLHPLDAAARVVREDLCLHLPAAGAGGRDGSGPSGGGVREPHEMVLVGGSVCFPTRWTLADKVGRSLDLIHGPVPGYADDVARQVNTFVARLGPGAGVWRRNWSLMPTGDLCLPGRHDYLPIGTEPADLWLRTERQTLRKLQRTGAVVFTIAIDVAPLATVAGSEVGRHLADTIETLPPAFLAYKGLTEGASAVVDYLRN